MQETFDPFDLFGDVRSSDTEVGLLLQVGSTSRLPALLLALPLALLLALPLALLQALPLALLLALPQALPLALPLAHPWPRLLA